MATLYSYFAPPKASPEKHKEGSITETAGFITQERRIKDMVASGQRLDSYRKESYDTSDLGEDLPVNPARKPGLDLSEADALARNVQNKLKASQDAKKKASQAVLNDAVKQSNDASKAQSAILPT